MLNVSCFEAADAAIYAMRTLARLLHFTISMKYVYCFEAADAAIYAMRTLARLLHFTISMKYKIICSTSQSSPHYYCYHYIQPNAPFYLSFSFSYITSTVVMRIKTQGHENLYYKRTSLYNRPSFSLNK